MKSNISAQQAYDLLEDARAERANAVLEIPDIILDEEEVAVMKKEIDHTAFIKMWDKASQQKREKILYILTPEGIEEYRQKFMDALCEAMRKHQN